VYFVYNDVINKRQNLGGNIIFSRFRNNVSDITSFIKYVSIHCFEDKDIRVIIGTSRLGTNKCSLFSSLILQDFDSFHIEITTIIARRCGVVVNTFVRDEERTDRDAPEGKGKDQNKW